jgi:hypothetical protein
VRIQGADLRLFEFDYDLTWYCFFINADETIYGRYGGRDASDPHGRISLKGLRFALESALEAHKSPPKPIALTGTPVRVDNFPAARRFKGGCIHCHNVNEFTRTDLKLAGKWERDSVWVYPLPENVGITLDVDQGNLIKAIKSDSPAAKIGVRAGDTLKTLNNIPVASFGDAIYALHKAPKVGSIPITWLSEGKEQTNQLAVAEGWRKTNVTWRPSMLDILPSAPFSGDDLKPEEKKQLGLAEKRAVFRQDKFVHSTLKAVGIQKDDVVIGIDGKEIEGTMENFLGYVRRNFLVGDKVTFNLLRDGKKVDAEMTLK